MHEPPYFEPPQSALNCLSNRPNVLHRTTIHDEACDLSPDYGQSGHSGPLIRRRLPLQTGRNCTRILLSGTMSVMAILRQLSGSERVIGANMCPALFENGLFPETLMFILWAL
jgi:hypothetical protein